MCVWLERCRDGNPQEYCGVRSSYLTFLEFHPYIFFQYFSCNLFLLFFWGEKSVDGCIDGIINFDVIRNCSLGGS